MKDQFHQPYSQVLQLGWEAQWKGPKVQAQGICQEKQLQREQWVAQAQELE